MTDSMPGIRIPRYGATRSEKEQINEKLVNAAKLGDIALIKKLVENGADINMVNSYLPILITDLGRKVEGISPLGAAAAAGQTETVETLLGLGADPNAPDRLTVMVPLHWTAQSVSQNILAVAEKLLAAGADVDHKNYTGQTPLMYSISQCNYSLTELFIRHGADINAKDTMGKTPIYIASDLANSFGSRMVKRLLQLGADPNSLDIHGTSPLCISRSPKSSLLLIDAGADINAVNNYGSTPAHIAAYNGRSDILDILLKKKADINKTDMRDLTPLHSAVLIYYGPENSRCVQLLLDAGADINAKSWKKQTPFYLACCNMPKYLVSMMMRYSPELNAADDYGETPFTRLAYRGAVSTMTILVKAGADLNIANNDGNTVFDILQTHYPRKYKKWIEKTVVRPRQKKLDKEDCLTNPGHPIDWNI